MIKPEIDVWKKIMFAARFEPEAEAGFRYKIAFGEEYISNCWVNGKMKETHSVLETIKAEMHNSLRCFIDNIVSHQYLVCQS